jgi:hypothetical protein
VWVDVRDEGVIGAVACIEKESHAHDQAEHDTLVVRVYHADDDQQDARDDAQKVDPCLLAPNVCALVDYVRDNSAQRSKDDVDQPKHSGPSSRPGLSEAWELLKIIGTQNGIDCQFGSKRAKVGGTVHQRLPRKDYPHCFTKTGVDNNFSKSNFKLTFLSQSSFMAMGCVMLPVFRIVRTAGMRMGVISRGRDLVVGESAGVVHNGTRRPMRCQFSVRMRLPIAPPAIRGVRAEENDGERRRCYANKWHDERYPPCDAIGEMPVLHHGVENRGHQEIRNSSSSISQSCGQRVGASHNIFVEEGCGPYLARHETCPENANKKPNDHQALPGGRHTCQGSWNRSG